MISDIWEGVFDILTTYGYVGVLVASFLGSLFPFVPGPYIIPVALLSLVKNPWLVAFFATVGSVLAKFLIFRASFLGGRLINDRTQTRMKPLKRFVLRYGSIAAFVAAVTPIPDDVVYIPLGVAKFSPWKFLIITFSGKFIITSIIAWSSRLSIPFVGFLSNIVDNPVSAAAVVITFFAVVALIIYTVFKADWSSILIRWFPWTVEENDE